MSSSFTKIRRGALALAVIVILSVIGYRFVAGYDWIESFWMVVITISTVGYSEHSGGDWAMQLLSIFVILMGTTAGAYTFTGLIQLVLQGEIDRAFGLRRMEKELTKLQGHTIICGFGKSGPVLAELLAAQNRQFVIIELDETNHRLAVSQGYLAIQADATDEDTLIRAGIQNASSIVVALPTDAENVFITLSARNLCPSVRIVAQAEQESTSRKLRQAGADEVVMAHMMVANYMSRLVTRPSTAEFFASLAKPEFEDLILEELIIPDGSEIVGRSIVQLRIRDQHELLVVAVKSANEVLDFNPGGDRVFATGETILVMGKQADVDAFEKRYGLTQT
ncbi:MAG: potassium channel protein [Planctomycetota bacterium]